jgi:hypothetical protein
VNTAKCGRRGGGGSREGPGTGAAESPLRSHFRHRGLNDSCFVPFRLLARSQSSLGARVFHQPVASYSAGRDIAAELTNLDIAATDHIRPIATTTAIPTMNGCIFRVTPAEAARQAGLLKSANAVRRKGAPGP